MIYPYPDVYLQEIIPAAEPQFLTAVPVFFGYADRGPVNEPTPIQLWPQFVATFGSVYPGGHLANAVRGFFENGGQVGYVIRLNDDEALTSLQSLQQGIKVATLLENIDLVCAPDLGREQTLAGLVVLQQEVLTHCQRLGDRFAILDTLSESSRETVLEHRSALNSSYGALYYPWLLAPENGEPVPPCGHVAGIFSRSDQRVGSHKAPGNEPIEDILGLQAMPSKIDQAVLFANNVNYLRPITGRGVRVWGVRTLSGDPNWQYINVRRLFITISRWIEQFMMTLPFEPHDGRLWVRITRELTTYLSSVYLQGALRGATTGQSFYVKCDAQTNPPDVREAGQIITRIGLAAVIPGEFIDIQVVRGSSGVTISIQ